MLPGTMGQLLTIGRFSRLSGLSIKMLRRYDEQGLLTPAHVDPSSGYRYYAAAQLEAAAQIKQLRGMELPLAQIQTYLSLPGALQRREFLQEQRTTLQRRVAEAQEQLQALQDLLDGAEKVEGYAIALRHIPQQTVAVVRQRVEEDALKGFIASSFLTVYRALVVAEVSPAGAGLMLFYERGDETQEVEVAVPIPHGARLHGELTTRVHPAHQAVCTLHRGSYETLPDAYRALQLWADEKGVTLGDPLCHVYEVGPAQTRNAEMLRTEVRWTVAPA